MSQAANHHSPGSGPRLRSLAPGPGVDRRVVGADKAGRRGVAAPEPALAGARGAEAFRTGADHPVGADDRALALGRADHVLADQALAARAVAADTRFAAGRADTRAAAAGADTAGSGALAGAGTEAAGL